MSFEDLWNEADPQPVATKEVDYSYVTDEQKLIDAKSRYKLLFDMLAIYFHVKHGEPRKTNQMYGNVQINLK